MGLTLEPGAVLGQRYRLERRLGQGGMGAVWAATDTVTERLVALKLLAGTDDPAKRQDLQARLRREARAAGRVQHPNVCEILDVLDLEDGSPALVMEHLDGESLGSLLARRRRLPLGELAEIFVQVLAGVGAVHAHGIVHRDLKPENVFLVAGPPRAVKVLDFGIAKLAGAEGETPASTQLTATGAVVGTPCYMSPEQFGERDIDRRTDVWSLGMLAYHCLSGVLPTQGGNVFEVFRKIADRPVPPLEGAAPGLPVDVTGLVGRMLARRRDQRPADLDEAMEVFSRYTGGRAGEIGASGPPREGDAAPAESPEGGDPAIDAMATTYSAVLVEPGPAPAPGVAAAPAPEAERAVALPVPETTGSGSPRSRAARPRRRAGLVAVVVAAALGGLGLALSPTAPGLRGSAATTPTAGDAPGSVTASPPSPPANRSAAIREPAVVVPSVPATATATAAATAAPRSGAPSAAPRNVHPNAAESASPTVARPPASAVPSAAPPRPSPKGGLVEEPPF